MDPFAENIEGVRQLIESGVNKTNSLNSGLEEGVEGQYEDILDLPMSDEELLQLKDEWEGKYNGYGPKIKPRQDRNKLYYTGKQRASTQQQDKVVSTNLIFEAEETFIPQALSKNPEPVVWSDNTDIGKQESNKIKTMLQYHADVLCLRKKLGVMVRHWSIYFLGVVKHGWDAKVSDIKTEIRKPQNFLLDPDGYIDEYGNFIGAFLGERIESSAQQLIDMFPKHKDYIVIKSNGKLGTQIVRTEWWTDDYCFTTFMDEVLDKHKNEYFNYETPEQTDELGNVTQSATPAVNHFAIPKMPYTFLSVFSLQERPHDITNLIEQNISNQDRINDRDEQISKNLASANNSVVLSGLAFTSENAGQARDTFYEEGFLLVPNGEVDKAVKRLPASEIPQSVFRAQENDMNNLRTIFGTQGLTAQPANEDTTARGMILNQSHDSTRIGGGIGDALEQVADNIFNWWLQLYCVFYDEPHYGAVMGNGQAVEYVALMNSDLQRKFVVSVAPNSMQPKDEISEQNLAVERWQQKAIDPINFMKKLNDPDPIQSAKMLVIWLTNPQQYAAMFFPEAGIQQPQGQPPQSGGGGSPPEQGQPPESLGQPAASSALSQVPISTSSTPQ